MRRLHRAGLRAALDAAVIPTFAAPGAAPGPEAIRFVRSPGSLPRGRRVYAVGDIHGHRDKLAALHTLIAADLRSRPTGSAVVLHLGDYIDQGPDSAGVVEFLLAGQGIPAVNLLGDHERMLLDALSGDRAAATDWLWAGGQQALISWGLDPDLPREDWEAGLPADHVRWLRGLTLTHREGGYLFVHAGIRPGVPLAEQTPEDLVGIRQPFLTIDRDHGMIVVHGHSGGPSVQISNNRIGIDTGVGIGGALTCAVLEDDVIGLIAV
nr:metallophosphoesterase [uncultured Rhodopila sp.]